MSANIVIDSSDPARTERIAEGLAGLLAGGELLALEGPLGAGKTCFVRGLARGLGIEPRKVRSPSFTVHHRYLGGRFVLEHYDAYFVREDAEFARDGLLEQLGEGHVAVVEWADRFPSEFARAALIVRFEVTGDESRRLEFSGPLAERFRDAILAFA